MLFVTATRKGYVSTREARNFDKEVMPASLMMTPPLAPTLERKWRTPRDHQDAMLEDR